MKTAIGIMFLIGTAAAQSGRPGCPQGTDAQGTDAAVAATKFCMLDASCTGGTATTPDNTCTRNVDGGDLDLCADLEKNEKGPAVGNACMRDSHCMAWNDNYMDSPFGCCEEVGTSSTSATTIDLRAMGECFNELTHQCKRVVTTTTSTTGAVTAISTKISVEKMPGVGETCDEDTECLADGGYEKKYGVLKKSDGGYPTSCCENKCMTTRTSFCKGKRDKGSYFDSTTSTMVDYAANAGTIVAFLANGATCDMITDPNPAVTDQILAGAGGGCIRTFGAFSTPCAKITMGAAIAGTNAFENPTYTYKCGESGSYPSSGNAGFAQTHYCDPADGESKPVKVLGATCTNTGNVLGAGTNNIQFNGECGGTSYKFVGDGPSQKSKPLCCAGKCIDGWVEGCQTNTVAAQIDGEIVAINQASFGTCPNGMTTVSNGIATAALKAYSNKAAPVASAAAALSALIPVTAWFLLN